MAATTTTTPLDEKVDHKASLKVFVDKEKNRVLFAEAKKDFVDVLLSFLTLPLGTVARLVAKESNIPPMKLGSVSSLYESVSNLDEENEGMWSHTCKEMLLHPNNSMMDYCQQLMLNIDDIEPRKFFVCENSWGCVISPSLLSTSRNQKCRCGKLMSQKHCILQNGFVKNTASFIICDDLSLIPNVLGTSFGLLRRLGCY